MNGLITALIAFAGPADLARFPDPDLAAATATFARDHARWAKAQAVASSDVPEFGWREYAEGAELRAACWRLLALAHGLEDQWPDMDLWVWVSDEAPLELLRELIGDEAFLEGRMPPVYPPRR